MKPVLSLVEICHLLSSTWWLVCSTKWISLLDCSNVNAVPLQFKTLERIYGDERGGSKLKHCEYSTDDSYYNIRLWNSVKTWTEQIQALSFFRRYIVDLQCMTFIIIVNIMIILKKYYNDGWFKLPLFSIFQMLFQEFCVLSILFSWEKNSWIWWCL